MTGTEAAALAATLFSNTAGQQDYIPGEITTIKAQRLNEIQEPTIRINN